MHQIDVVGGGDVYDVGLGAFDMRRIHQESGQRQRGATEEFGARRRGDFDAEVAGVLNFPIERRVVGAGFVHVLGRKETKGVGYTFQPLITASGLSLAMRLVTPAASITSTTSATSL